MENQSFEQSTNGQLEFDEKTLEEFLRIPELLQQEIKEEKEYRNKIEKFISAFDTTTFQPFMESLRKKDEMISQLHTELTRLRNGLYEELKRPMIKTIIGIHKRCFERQQKAIYNVPGEGRPVQIIYEEMVADLNFDLHTIEDSIEEHFDLSFFCPSEGDSFDREQHHEHQQPARLHLPTVGR